MTQRGAGESPSILPKIKKTGYALFTDDGSPVNDLQLIMTN
jgi:hypothetical protein